MALAFGIVTVLYIGLAVATIGVTGGTRLEGAARRPDLGRLRPRRARRHGRARRRPDDGDDERLHRAASRSSPPRSPNDGALPPWLGGDAHRSVPRRPLVVIAVVAVVAARRCSLAGVSNTDDLVRATSACFIAVYVLAVYSATRILDGRLRALAWVTLAMVLVLAVFSTWYLAVPVVAALRSRSLTATGTIAEAAGLGPPFAMLKRIEIPVADPGDPDTRSPVRLLVWVGRHQSGTLARGRASSAICVDARPGADAVRDRPRDPARDRRARQPRLAIWTLSCSALGADAGVRGRDAAPLRRLQLAPGLVPARAGRRAPRRPRRPRRPRARSRPARSSPPSRTTRCAPAAPSTSPRASRARSSRTSSSRSSCSRRRSCSGSSC